MKYCIISSIMILVLVSIHCHDSFLDVAPTSSLSTTEVASKAGLERTLIGTYSILLSRSGFYGDASNWFWGSVLGGDANKGSESGDQVRANEIQRYNALPNNTAILEKYSMLYEGVARANATLRLLLDAGQQVSSNDKVRIEAEAGFLRGHFYFELKKHFNNTPYVDEFWDEVTPVRNDQDLWPNIEADFQFAFEQLPETQIAPGRANKWAAGAYLAKAFLFQGKYSEAKQILDQVITNGTTASGVKYNLMPNYADLFRSTNDNNMESIFAVQAAVGTGTTANANPAWVLNFPSNGGAPGRCCGFFQPSLDLANSFRTDVNGLPLLDKSYNNPENALINDLGLSTNDSFIPDTGPLDPRLDHSIGRRGIPYLDWGFHPGIDWIRDQVYGGPYSPKKFIYSKAGIGTENDVSGWSPGFTSINYNIIRFADVLLLAAEAEIELGSLEQGMKYINRVRNRAKDSQLTEANANYLVSEYTSFSSQSEARDALRFERKLELSGEGHRFYDLVRWGTAADILNTYLQYEDQFIKSPFTGATFTPGKSEYLPIPQEEIDVQGEDVLMQNPGY